MACDLENRELGPLMLHIGLYLGTKDKICGWNSIRDIANWFGWFGFFFYPFMGNLTLSCDLDHHRHLGHRMCLIGMYHDTMYKVCGWNSFWDMASNIVFCPFREIFEVKDYRHLGRWMCFFALYLHTKYKVIQTSGPSWTPSESPKGRSVNNVLNGMVCETTSQLWPLV